MVFNARNVAKEEKKFKLRVRNIFIIIFLSSVGIFPRKEKKIMKKIGVWSSH